MSSLPVSASSIDDSARLRAGSAASWGSILAGAVVAVSLSLVLVTLGAGLGFAAVSPWSDHGVSASGFTVTGTIWLIVTQWLSAAAGGYLAGRLRARWLATHTHEVFFRDTAHGLVTWSVATLIVAAVLGSSVAHLAGAGARAVGALGASAVTTGAETLSHSPPAGAPGHAEASDPKGDYLIDRLFRKNLSGEPAPARDGPTVDARREVLHIVAAAAANGSVSPEDRAYLATLVAHDTGVAPEEAQKRVDSFVQSLDEAKAQAQEAADKARKSAALAALYASLALLIGAFIASVSAAIGGRLRDEHL